jgi:hypothetical protein
MSVEYLDLSDYLVIAATLVAVLPNRAWSLGR